MLRHASGRRRATMWLSGVGAASLVMVGVATAAGAAEQDEITAFEIAASCGTQDDIQVRARYSVAAQPGTAPGDRITGMTIYHDGEERDWPMQFDIVKLPGGVDHLATGDYEFNLSLYIARSTLQGDYFAVEFTSDNGVVFASDEFQVDCYTGLAGVTLFDITEKARLGVPRKIRPLEHLQVGGLFDPPIVQTWVASAGTIPATPNTDEDVLALSDDEQAALGATLADRLLTVTATEAGSFELDWGVVTNAVDGELIEFVDGNELVDIEVSPFKVWVEHPQWVWVEHPQWVWDVEPDSGPIDGDLQHLEIRELGEGHLEGGNVVWINGPQWVEIPWANSESLIWLETSSERLKYGPATLSIEVVDGPIQPDESIIVDENRGDVSAPAEVDRGETFTLDVGSQNADGWVDVWLHSEPTYLGLFPVGPDGTVDITVPSNFESGDHRVVVTDEVGEFLGWDDIVVTAVLAGGNTVPGGATGLDERSWGLWAMLALGSMTCAALALTTAPRLSRR